MNTAVYCHPVIIIEIRNWTNMADALMVFYTGINKIARRE